jgi:hypothetical protein
MYYNVICILYALLCRQNFILVKSGCYTSKIENILTTLDITRVAPSENRIQRGSGDCQLEAPQLNPRSWRWQTRCPCWMCRGHWLGLLGRRKEKEK